jgi:adenylate cyclase, class 2
VDAREAAHSLCRSRLFAVHDPFDSRRIEKVGLFLAPADYRPSLPVVSAQLSSCIARWRKVSFFAEIKMSKEIEVKIRLDGSDAVRKRLLASGADLLAGRHFEDNLILDFPDGLLGSRQSLLRVRYTANGGVVTFKGAPEPGSRFKIREELETTVARPEMMLQIFDRLGFQVRFRYQKYREEFLFRIGEREVRVALDDTPIGSYAEVEGYQEGIVEVAGRIGFRETEFLPDSYYRLYLKYCTARGEAPAHMVFDTPAKEPILRGGDNL